MTRLHLLSQKKVKSFRYIREEEVCRTMAKIRAASDDNRAVDLSAMAMVLASSLICRVTAGKDYDEHGAGKKRFYELAEGFQLLTTSFYFSDYFPALGWLDRLTGSINKADIMCRRMDSMYQELIDEHLESRRVGKKEEEEEDILDILIRLKEEKSSPIDISWDNIKALLMVSVSSIFT